MKTKISKTKERKWGVPGGTISVEEFKAGIKAAEKGPFTTLEQLKKSVEEWKKSQNL
jgi:hypothetical protein